MSFKKIEPLLRESFEDAKLDRKEKYEIISLLEKCTDEQRNYARNLAFDIARESLLSEKERIRRLKLKWLEDITKALDKATPSVKAAAYFSPGEKCRSTIIRLCNQARSTIDVCVFTISDNMIRDELLAAHRRRIAIRILTDNDKSEDRGSDIEAMAAAGITTKMDTSPHHMHHKYAIFDGKILLNGSFNWTCSATERNEENITVLEHKPLVTQFQHNFDELWKKAERL